MYQLDLLCNNTPPHNTHIYNLRAKNDKYFLSLIIL